MLINNLAPMNRGLKRGIDVAVGTTVWINNLAPMNRGLKLVLGTLDASRRT